MVRLGRDTAAAQSRRIETISVSGHPEARENQIPKYGSLGYSLWLKARHQIEGLREAVGGPRWLDVDGLFVVSKDLEVALGGPNIVGPTWWNYAEPVEIELERVWLVVRPASQATGTRLVAGTSLRLVVRTDPMWWAIVGSSREEALFEILDGPQAGLQCVAVNRGPSDALSGVAGQLITSRGADLAVYADAIMDAAAPFVRAAVAQER